MGKSEGEANTTATVTIRWPSEKDLEEFKRAADEYVWWNTESQQAAIECLKRVVPPSESAEQATIRLVLGSGEADVGVVLQIYDAIEGLLGERFPNVGTLSLTWATSKEVS